MTVGLEPLDPPEDNDLLSLWTEPKLDPDGDGVRVIFGDGVVAPGGASKLDGSVLGESFKPPALAAARA